MEGPTTFGPGHWYFVMFCGLKLIGIVPPESIGYVVALETHESTRMRGYGDLNAIPASNFNSHLVSSPLKASSPLCAHHPCPRYLACSPHHRSPSLPPFLTSSFLANSLPFTIALSTPTHRPTTSHARPKTFVLTQISRVMAQRNLLLSPSLPNIISL